MTTVGQIRRRQERLAAEAAGRAYLDTLAEERKARIRSDATAAGLYWARKRRRNYQPPPPPPPTQKDANSD